MERGVWITLVLPLVFTGLTSHAFHLGHGNTGQRSTICRQAPPCCQGHVCRAYQRFGSSRPVAACALTPDSRPLYAPGSRTQRRICSPEASSTFGGLGQSFSGRSQVFGRSGPSMAGHQSSASIRPAGPPGEVRSIRWNGRELPPQLPGMQWDSAQGNRRRISAQGFQGRQRSRPLSGQGFRDSRSGMPRGFDPPVPQFGERISQPRFGQPGFDQSGFGQPSFGQGSLRQPNLRQPSLRQPGLGQPSLRQPGLGQPSLRQSSLGQSSLGQSGLPEPSRSQPGFGSFPTDIRSQQLLGGQLNTFADIPQDQRPFIQGQPSFGHAPMPAQGQPSFGHAPMPAQGQPSFGHVSMPAQGHSFSSGPSFGQSIPGLSGTDLTSGQPGQNRGQRSFDQGHMDLTMTGPSGASHGFGQMPENILPPSGGLPQSFLAEQPPITATAIGGSQSSSGGQSLSQSQTGSSQPLDSQSQGQGQRLGVQSGPGGPRP